MNRTRNVLGKSSSHPLINNIMHFTNTHEKRVIRLEYLQPHTDCGIVINQKLILKERIMLYGLRCSGVGCADDGKYFVKNVEI